MRVRQRDPRANPEEIVRPDDLLLLPTLSTSHQTIGVYHTNYQNRRHMAVDER